MYIYIGQERKGKKCSRREREWLRPSPIHPWHLTLIKSIHIAIHRIRDTQLGHAEKLLWRLHSIYLSTFNICSYVLKRRRKANMTAFRHSSHSVWTFRRKGKRANDHTCPFALGEAEAVYNWMFKNTLYTEKQLGHASDSDSWKPQLNCD